MPARTVAIVGLGAAARNIHLPACAELGPALRVVAGADPAAAPNDFPFPVLPSLEDLLARHRPDILVVATPPPFHHAQCRQGLEAGCHVICEKPFTETLEDADDLASLAATTGRALAVNQELRFLRIHQAARELIGTPEFGDLRFLAAEQTFFVTPETEAGWRGRSRRRTCQDFGVHVLDLCRYLFGEEPLSVRARMPLYGPGPDLLDLIELELPKDRIAQITLDRWCRGRHRYLSMRLDGSEGCIETTIGGRAALALGIGGGGRPFADVDLAPGGSARLYHGERYRTIARERSNVFARGTAELYRRFLAALDAGTEPPCSAADNRKTLALVLAAYASAERGSPIPVGEARDR